MDANVAKTLWYAEGLRWIGSVLSDAANRLEEQAAAVATLDPRANREIESYVDDLRTRVHLHF
jgi:hypothetical protein